MNWFRNPRFYADGLPGVGLLILRLWMGYAMAMHGLPKMSNPFGWMGPNVPGVLQGLAAAGEFFGGLGLLFGALTPIAAFGVMSVMFVATLSFFTNDVTPTYFVNMGPKVPGDNAEAPFVYFIFALTLFLTGPGLLSIDAFLAKYLLGRKTTPPAVTKTS
ncbi:DoxX family protein [bacterium]|nr:MAG: DoxX family protein [bacterium]